MKVTGPKVTIAVPTFNRPAMLERCLTTLLGQIGPDVEIYVSDDASEAETGAVLARFDDSRLRKSRNAANLGLFENFNQCLMNAAGAFIIFLSDDDLIDDDLIPSCLALLNRDDSGTRDVAALIAANRYLTIGADGDRYISEVKSELPTAFYDGDVLLEALWFGRISFQLCGILFHTETLRAIGGFTTRHRYSGDLRTFATLFFQRRVGFEASAKCTYVVHPQSETAALGVRYRLADLSRVFNAIVQQARSDLPKKRSRRIAAGARRYMTTEYLRNLVEFHRLGGSRNACLAAFLPGVRWMTGPGGRPVSTTLRFLDAVVLPLWLRELYWTLQRTWKRTTSSD